MPFPVIYNTGDRSVLVIDPPEQDDGNFLLPSDTPSAVATLPDNQRAVFDTPNSRFNLSQDLATVVATTQPDDPNAQLRGQIITTAQTAVGVSLADLTQAQRNALMACLLFAAGGVGTDSKVRPLGEWIR